MGAGRPKSEDRDRKTLGVLRKFAVNLKKLRKAKKMSGYELAHISGVTKQSISLFEKSQRDPSWSIMLKLADALGVSVAEFS